MRIGLLADIHEAVDLLDLALERLQAFGVDQYVFLGDVFETGPRLAETVERLRAIDAVGVWGNHDHGLCVDPSEETRRKYPARALEYTATLRASIELAGCFFSHIEPWLDPNDLSDLWHIEVDSTFEDEIARNFSAHAHPRSFMGHKHRWLAVIDREPRTWRGEGPIALPTHGRWLVVLAAVVDGHCAHYDAESGILTPISLL